MICRSPLQVVVSNMDAQLATKDRKIERLNAQIADLHEQMLEMQRNYEEDDLVRRMRAGEDNHAVERRELLRRILELSLEVCNRKFLRMFSVASFL